MKALFLRTDFYGHLTVGGSFSHVKGFLGGLRKGGHDYVAVSSGELPAEKEKFAQIPYSDLFRNLPEVLSLAYNYRLINSLPAIIDREKPDFLYHRHSEFNYSSSVLAKRLSLPLVLEFNGSEVWVKKNWGRAYLTFLLRWAEDVQLRRADIIAVVSDVIRDDLVRMGINRSRILVNPNGVDPDVFRPDLDVNDLRQQHELDGKIVVC
ncbi:MAG: glycosyltransferase, partial [Ignavibacteriales bacterium]|nr:glycosyltransferase [Ignavibacteriales bacterium]